MNSPAQAPVAVFAFNRADLLDQTLRSLGKCHGLSGRLVVIFCDGPRDAVPSDQQGTAEVRRLAERWGKAVGAAAEFRSGNLGLRRSIISGVGRMLEQHGRVIVLEDDLVTSPWFLRFMDEALEQFADIPNVWQVSGWSAPTGLTRLSSGFLRVPGCWGWATWKRAWDHYNDDAVSLLQRVLSADQHRFNIDGSYDYFNSLRENAVGSLNTWHVRWYASMFLQNALAVYPGVSLTRNIGFDSRGTNCDSGRTTSIFTRQKVARHLPLLPAGVDAPAESPELLQAMRDLFLWQGRMWAMPPLRTRIWNRLRRLLGL